MHALHALQAAEPQQDHAALLVDSEVPPERDAGRPPDLLLPEWDRLFAIEEAELLGDHVKAAFVLSGLAGLEGLHLLLAEERM